MATKPTARTIRICGATATSMILLSTLSGCFSAGDSSTPALEQNRSEWVMPLDAFTIDFWDESDYATNLAVRPCMTDAGYEWDVPYRDFSSESTPTLNSSQRKLFNVAIAEQWGYHNAGRIGTTAAAARAFVEDGALMTDAAAAQFSQCLEEVRADVLPAMPGNLQLANSLEQAAYEAALQDPEVLSAAERWRACMGPQGVSDLPLSPDLMPSDSVNERFGVNIDPGLDPDGASKAASVDEIRLATFDAECRESSGWAETLYQHEWNRSETALEENVEGLASIKTQMEEARASTQAVIAEYAPPAP